MKRLVIDTETTGLSHVHHKTLTVGMLLIEVEKNFLEILNKDHIFIKHEDYTIDPNALKINKIDIKEHHKKGVFPDIACEKIIDFVNQTNSSSTKLLGHNISFDKGFLNSLFTKEKRPIPFHSEYSDTMYFWQSLKREGLVPYHLRANLQTISDFFKIDYSKAHDALEDCHITAKAYQKMLELKSSK